MNNIENYINLKNKYFNFFQKRGYNKLPSGNLIIEDPNLLFTVAGMVQFKEIFLREKPKTFDRVITIQQCLRVGGKHNDLENVGFTKRHNTLFEMMGHFAFYDDNYSKEQIIKDAFDFLVKELSLNIDRFWVTIDHQDDESYGIWSKIIDEKKIIRELTGENFWSMGDDGPCGFCTEILYDRIYDNEIIEPKDVLKNSERFLEIWNIVFMTKIKNKGIITDTTGLSIDTGMGLERLLSILENSDNNFETSCFLPIINFIKTLIPNGPDYVYKICADHSRAITFLLAEGLQISNSKHGYVLKKLIRRSIVYYHPYYKKPLLWQLIPVIQDLMGSFYPYLYNKNIADILYTEELKIIDHLENSEEIIKKNINENEKFINGSKMFFLYDTWGVNLQLLEDYASINHIELDYDGFQKAMELQKFQSGQKIIIDDHLDETIFIGSNNYYDKNIDYTANIIGIYNMEGKISIVPDESMLIVTDKTWFFPESCGQVGDEGVLIYNNQEFIVKNTFHYNSLHKKVIVHWIHNPQKISINLGSIILKVDYPRRINIARNHTATHLFNKVFNEIIGPSEQKGSWVGPDKFRWDTNGNPYLNHQQIVKIENKINEIIKENIPIEINYYSLEEAKKDGYCYLKNTYYENNVRCVNINNWSKELCNGTHVNQTQEILGFKILKHKSISSGVVRWEAITGDEWLKFQQQQQNLPQVLQDAMINGPDSIQEIIQDIVKNYHNKNFNLVKKSYEKIVKIYPPIEDLKNYIQEEIVLPLATEIISFNSFQIFVGYFEKVDLILYDQYKNKYQLVILMGQNNGIIIGSENHREEIPSLSQLINNNYQLKGSGDHRLFRGKIMENITFCDVVNLFKKS